MDTSARWARLLHIHEQQVSLVRWRLFSSPRGPSEASLPHVSGRPHADCTRGVHVEPGGT